jgi:hypothetical protein
VHKRKFVPAVAFAIAGSLCLAACSGSTPTVPTGSGNGGGGGGTQPPANVPPVIDSFTVQGTRSPREPANFADVGETVPVTAAVHDDDTPAAQLEYQWSASAGTFSGTGANVNWMAPPSASTPADVTITLKVVDHYGFPGQTPAFTQSVTGTTTISLHDSANEVGTMARQFLLDFSDSSIRDVAYIMRNFQPGCYGTADETDQVAGNRVNFNIVRSVIGGVSVTVPFGNALCPIPGRIQHGDACTAVPSHWESVVLESGPLKGQLQIVDGVDWVAAFYYPDQKAWKLCDSQYVGKCLQGCGTDAAAAVRHFIR